MSATRRDFLELGFLTGAALLLRVPLVEGEAVRKAAEGGPSFAPNPWIAIDSAGTVTLVADRVEMGQGARTALAMILAEELGADWTSVRIGQPIPGPDFRDMRTSGSSAVIERWNPLRAAGAVAREMLVSAAAARWSVDAGSCVSERGEIVHLPTGRRLGFGELAEAASKLPVPRQPRLKDPASFSIVGTRVTHVDAPTIARGAAQFGLDVRLPGMLYAAVRHSPVYGGSPKSYDASKARAITGVRDVVPLSEGLAVVADSSWAALKGCEALEISWDERGKGTEDSKQYWRRLEEALRRGGKPTRSEGDVEAALSSASRRFEATYRYGFQAHATLEPMNCVARVGKGTCEIWSPTQAPNQAQEEAARRLGLELDRVTVHTTLVGGGFGRRLGVDTITEAVEVARAVRAPVKLFWSRPEDLQHDMYNPAAIHELAAALDAKGYPRAWRHRSATFHLSMFGPFRADDPDLYEGSPWGGPDTPYRFDAIRVEYAPLASPVPTGAWRSVEYPSTVFARESFLDEIAHATGTDPLALRLSLLPSPGMEKVGQLTLANGDRLATVLKLAAEKAGWNAPFSKEHDGRRFGRGIACNPYHRQSMVAQVAEVSVGKEGDIRVHRVVAAIDCGRPVNPAGIEAQVEGGVIWGLSAVLRTEITFQNGRAEQSNFDDFPVLRIDEAPRIETHIVPSTIRPLGVGEQPVPPVFAAVANAVFDATGKRIRRIPIRAGDLKS
jgi:isoquinoline 1-oxidoreductase subunit beta